MTTWDKARDAKTERQRREQRHYYREHLGKGCPACGLRVVLAVGHPYHPTCGPEAEYEMGRAR